MELSFVEKGFYADVVGPCSHNHEDSCGEYARRVAAGSLETVAELRAENTRLQERVEEAEVLTEVLTEGIKAGLSHLDWRYASSPPSQHRVHEGEAIEALTGVLDAEGVERTITARAELITRYKALAKRRKKALEEYGRHGLSCTYGLLPAGVHRQGFSEKENARLRRTAIKECTCGFRAAIEEEK